MQISFSSDKQFQKLNIPQNYSQANQFKIHLRTVLINAEADLRHSILSGTPSFLLNLHNSFYTFLLNLHQFRDKQVGTIVELLD